MTAQLARWADEHSLRLAWIIEYVGRHNAGGWGDLDQMDAAINDAAMAPRVGRVLSRYLVPTPLLDEADDDAIWIITDDHEVVESMTTILWPSDY
jgi:hypothetical protein